MIYLQDEYDDIVPSTRGSSEAYMDEAHATGAGSRRNEDIALDMMKFIASTTAYGRGTTGTPGFTGATAAKPEDYAAQLIELYGRCLNAVQGKR